MEDAGAGAACDGAGGKESEAVRGPGRHRVHDGLPAPLLRRRRHGAGVERTWGGVAVAWGQRRDGVRVALQAATCGGRLPAAFQLQVRPAEDTAVCGRTNGR